MFTKVLAGLGLGLVLAASSLTAAPAHASAAPGAERTASWGTNGSVTMRYDHGQWKGTAKFVGLGRGHY